MGDWNPFKKIAVRLSDPLGLRKYGPKELNPDYQIAKTDEALGLTPPAPETPPGIAPPEQIDADAYNARMRRRRARGGGSTIRTSPQGAAYSGAPKQLTGQ